MPNADIYQLLAYLTALQLNDGLLVYATGEAIPGTVTVRFTGKRVHVRTVHVSRSPTEVLAQVRDLAHLTRRIAAAQSAVGRAS